MLFRCFPRIHRNMAISYGAYSFGNGQKNGVTVVELLIMLFIFGIAMSALFALVAFGLQSASIAQQTTRAVFFAQEAIEATKSFRDTTDWDVNGLGTLTLGMDYHLELQGATPEWRLVSGAETTDGFIHKVVFNEVQRDGSDNIVSNGGIVDPDTKKAIVTISWQERSRAREFKLTTYLTNWR